MYVPTEPNYTWPSQPSTLYRAGDSGSWDEDEVFMYDIFLPQTPSPGIAGYIASQATELAGIALEDFFLAIFPPDFWPQGGISGRLPKRARKWLRTVYFEKYGEIEHEDIIDEETSTSTARHLACPFYLCQKERHLSCLTRADIRDIRDLKRHLWTAHRQPSYCPICNDTFDVTEDWENHVRLRSCAPSGKPRPEGITRLQMQQFALRTGARVSRAARWRLIWEIVFPGVEPPSPEVISGEVETAVWVLRDFWSAEGNRIVSSFLAERQQEGAQVQNDESTVAALGSLVLDRAIDQLVASFK